MFTNPTLQAIYMQQEAEGAARHQAALDAYGRARAEMIAASASGDRDRQWRAASDYRDAERLLLVFQDVAQYGAISDQIVAEIKAEQAARQS
jgi:hypothetical protein